MALDGSALFFEQVQGHGVTPSGKGQALNAGGGLHRLGSHGHEGWGPSSNGNRRAVVGRRTPGAATARRVACFTGLSGSSWLEVQFRNWPHTRARWARIAQELKAARARAVLFDAVMDERQERIADLLQARREDADPLARVDVASRQRPALPASFTAAVGPGKKPTGVAKDAK
ncbi:CHASE2 domain-containing protein [Corallococcus coralloides]|nr:CHASE2 domain-containing protein [Corallococcus coralloides]